MKKRFTLILALPALWLCHHSSFAGWISEVQPQSRQVNDITQTQTISLPVLIEASGLSSLDQPEIVILNASSEKTRHGRILQTISIGPGTDVRQIQDSALNLNGPRILLLFDQITGLVADSGQLQNDQIQNLSSQLLDVVTYGPAGLTSAFDGELVLEWSPGQVIARPMRTESHPWDNLYVVGQPDPNGFLTGTDPLFRLNPGFANPIWQPLHTPSPNTAALLAATLPLLWALRRSNPPCRHHHA